MQGRQGYSDLLQAFCDTQQTHEPAFYCAQPIAPLEVEQLNECGIQPHTGRVEIFATFLSF